MWTSSPSNLRTPLELAPHSRNARSAMASKTGCGSVERLLMILRTSAAAVCCSRASCSRFWSWLIPGIAFFCGFRAPGSLAATFAFAGFARRRSGLFLLFISDRLGERAPKGKRLVYREVEDLSHTYPRDENPKILDWLADPTAAAAG
jgi:hypothetical protein